MKTLQKPTLIILMASLLSACVSLKHVHDFSSASLTGVQGFNELGYSFESHCKANCRAASIRNLNILDEDCDCTSDQMADSVTLKIYNVVQGYFDGLTKLSDKTLTNYKTDDLQQALIEGDFGSITVGQKEVTSYSKISGVLLRVFTDTYRKNKLKGYVKEANTPVLQLLAFLKLNISSNLQGKLNVRRQRARSYHFDLVNDSTLSNYEKARVVKAYHNELHDIDQKQVKLLVYGKTLDTITEGHQQLFNQIDHLNEAAAKQVLYQYASELGTMITELKKVNE
ncbi:hypothetical protein [uncultured Croceitalea sp.]|uniref:hypothetical protein n=1 Tax=uncultured Croceitalea sp. TaxID=1798908 RepID=UPI0033059F73